MAVDVQNLERPENRLAGLAAAVVLAYLTSLTHPIFRIVLVSLSQQVEALAARAVRKRKATSGQMAAIRLLVRSFLLVVVEVEVPDQAAATLEEEAVVDLRELVDRVRAARVGPEATPLAVRL